MEPVNDTLPTDNSTEALDGVGSPSQNLLPPAASQDFSQPAMTTSTVVDADSKVYPSLYDTLPTTVGAIAIGIGIIGGIQWTVSRIFRSEKADHKALTQFVTSMFALIVGVWIADKLIAGPSTELIDPEESKELLTFIKDITLMVFSYYFGTKAQVPSDNQEIIS